MGNHQILVTLQYKERKTENGKRNRRTKQEHRVLAHYALQEGGKARKAGLKRETNF